MGIKIIVCLFASLGAGLGTGLAGISAAAVITPMLVTFLGIPAYQAIGIALAADVLASAVSAFIYGRNKNLDIKNGLVLLVFVLAFTLLGSWVSSLINSTGLGYFSIGITIFLGLKFLIFPTARINRSGNKGKYAWLKSALCGAAIGFVCGFVGAGGGLMMLIVLTAVLGYELKTAVGTSVFVMSFTALTGAVSHFVIGGVYDIAVLVMCIIFTFVFAQLASLFANKASEKLQNRVTGGVLVVLGVVMLIFNLV